MRVCFITSELFSWGFYGGFGALTRTLGREISKKGIETCIIMPSNSPLQKPVEIIDGMRVLSIPSNKHQPVFTLKTGLRSKQLFKECNADVFHSEEPSMGTYIAMKATPEKKHIITFQDPRLVKEEMQVSRLSKFSEIELTKQYFNLHIQNMFLSRATKKADALYCQAKYAINIAKNLYKTNRSIGFLPNPVSIPEHSPKKSDEPTVCFLARWDPVKRPQLYFALAEALPDVKFIAMGKSPHQERDNRLRQLAKKIKNLVCPGFVSEEKKQEILDSSWILVNTSVRECLPVSFLEALAHKCAILSFVNPDNFASNFGLDIQPGMDKYVHGIKYLIKDERWKIAGERGYNFVKETFEMNKVVDQHIDIYRNLIEC